MAPINFYELGINNPSSLLEQLIEQATDLGIEIPQEMLPPVRIEPEAQDILDEVESRVNLDAIEEAEIVDENVYYLYYTDFNTSVNGNLSIESGEIDKNIAILISVLERMYGNTFDIELDKNNENIIVTLYYKDITIRNSSPNTHNIKSLFVQIYLENTEDQRLFLFNQFRGARFQITDIEYISQYRHSHLGRTRGIGQFDSFCIGGGIYNTYYKTSQTKPTPHAVNYIGISDSVFNPTLEDIEISIQSFFISIDNYVQWESTEGGPYIRYANLGYKAEEINIDNSGVYNVTDYPNKYRKAISELEYYVISNIDLFYNSDYVISRITELYEIEHIINGIPNELIARLPSIVLCYYDDGLLYSCVTLATIEDKIDETNFTFRGRPVKHITKKTIDTIHMNIIVRPNIILAMIAKYKNYLLLNT